MSFGIKEDRYAEEEIKPEEIVAKLRQVDVLVSQGQNMAEAICQIGVSEVTFYRWRQEFGGRKYRMLNVIDEFTHGPASAQSQAQAIDVRYPL